MFQLWNSDVLKLNGQRGLIIIHTNLINYNIYIYHLQESFLTDSIQASIKSSLLNSRKQSLIQLFTFNKHRRSGKGFIFCCCCCNLQKTSNPLKTTNGKAVGGRPPPSAAFRLPRRRCQPWPVMDIQGGAHGALSSSAPVRTSSALSQQINRSGAIHSRRD